MHRKPLFWIGSLIGLLLLLSATLAIYVGTRSDEWWRDLLTDTLSQTLGREVEILGDFRLQLGRRITAEAASVRVGNPDWAEKKDMLRLGSILLEFDLLSTLADTLVIYRMELADIELDLEESKTGEKNWAFKTKSKPSPARKPDKAIALPVRVEKLSLQRAQLSVDQPRWERPMVLKVDVIGAGQTSDDEAVFDASGRLGELPFRLTGNFGKITSALNAGPVSYQLSGSLGDASLDSKGSIESFAVPLRPQIELVISGPDILPVTRAMGAPKIAEGPFQARADISPGGRGINGRIRGEFGKLQLNADISVDATTLAENMDVTARLSGENLAAFADLIGLPPLPKGAFKVDAVLQRNDNITQIEKMTASVAKHQVSLGGVVGAWPELKGTRLELKAKGPDLAAFSPTIATIGLAQLPPGAYSVDALIEPGDTGLHLRHGKVTAGGYQATAKGLITTRGKFRAELDVTGAGPDLSMITRLVDIIQLPAWPFKAMGRIVITNKDITIIGASGSAGKHKVATDGPIAFSATGPLQLDVKGSGPSLQAVLQGLGYDVIPAAAAYQVEGKVKFTGRRIVVTAKQASLGAAVASATLTIPDVKKPTALVVNVDSAKTTDLSATLALAGVKIDLPHVMPADLKGQIKRSKDTTRLSKIRGTIGEVSVKVDGTIGDLPAYRKTRVTLDIAGPDLGRFLDQPVRQALPFQIKGSVTQDKEHTRFEDLKLKLANIEGRVHGHVGNWEKIKGSELTISAKGPNLDAVAAILDRPLPEGALKFDGHVRGVENAFHIDRMDAQIGQSNFSGDLTLKRGEPPLLTGRVNSSYMDFALFRKETETEKTSSTKTRETVNTDPEDDDASAQETRLLLFPDTPIELKAGDQLDLDLEIRIDELANLSQRGAMQDLSARVRLKGRDFSVSDFTGRGPIGSKVNGNLVIKRDADLSRFEVNITGKQLRIGLVAAPGQELESYPPTDIEVKLTGAGSTYHQLAASLDGRIKTVQGQGRINHSSINFLLSDFFYELFQLLNPFSKSEATTQLHCSVAIVNLADGIADIQSLVVQTDKLNIVSAGRVDLNTELINIDFSTRPRKGLGISASMITNSYIKLGGTLVRPSIALDPEGAAVATGAAVVTGGLSILAKGFWDRFLSTRDPCGQALERDAELQAKKAKK